MDWNYFFSAFAQCGAAIIGIFGAFIVTKIVAEEKGYYEVEFENCELEDEDQSNKEKHERQLLSHIDSHLQTYKTLVPLIWIMMIGVIPLVILPLSYLPTFDSAEPPLRQFWLWNNIWGMRTILLIAMFAFTELFFAFCLWRLCVIKDKYRLVRGKLDIVANTLKQPI